MFLLGDDRRLVISASDLRTASACEFALVRGSTSLLGRAERVAVADDPMAARVIALGNEHEQTELRRLVAGAPRPGRAVRAARATPPDDLDRAHAQTVEALHVRRRGRLPGDVLRRRLRRPRRLPRAHAPTAGSSATPSWPARESVPALLQIAAYAALLRDGRRAHRARRPPRRRQRRRPRLRRSTTSSPSTWRGGPGSTPSSPTTTPRRRPAAWGDPLLARLRPVRGVRARGRGRPRPPPRRRGARPDPSASCSTRASAPSTSSPCAPSRCPTCARSTLDRLREQARLQLAAGARPRRRRALRGHRRRHPAPDAAAQPRRRLLRLRGRPAVVRARLDARGGSSTSSASSRSTPAEPAFRTVLGPRPRRGAAGARRLRHLAQRRVASGGPTCTSTTTPPTRRPRCSGWRPATACARTRSTSCCATGCSSTSTPSCAPRSASRSAPTRSRSSSRSTWRRATPPSPTRPTRSSSTTSSWRPATPSGTTRPTRLLARDRRLQPRRLRLDVAAARLAARPGRRPAERRPRPTCPWRRGRSPRRRPRQTPSDQRLALMRLETLLRDRLDGIRPHERTRRAAGRRARRLVGAVPRPRGQAGLAGALRAAAHPGGRLALGRGRLPRRDRPRSSRTGTETRPRAAATPHAAAGRRADARHPHRSGRRGQRRLPRPAARRRRRRCPATPTPGPRPRSRSSRRTTGSPPTAGSTRPWSSRSSSPRTAAGHHDAAGRPRPVRGAQHQADRRGPCRGRPVGRRRR